MKPKDVVHAIVLAWGWRRWLIAFAAGALSAAAMAPLNAWPVLFLTFPVLVWLIDGAGLGRWGGITVAATTGWWFGFGYFLAGLYWVGFAFLVDVRTFGWLMQYRRLWRDSETLPRVGSIKRGIRLTSVLFPLPVCPTMAIVVPAGISRSTFFKAAPAG